MAPFPPIAFAILLSSSAPAPIVVLIPPASRTASAAAAHLTGELGGSAEVEAPADFDGQALFARARAAWPDSMIVILDPKKNEASLMRPHDDAVLVRRLPSRAETPASAFALAIAAAELVRIAASDVETARAAKEVEIEAPLEWEVAISIGMGLSGSPGSERTFAHPVFGADLRAGADEWWSALGVRVRGPSSTTIAAADDVTIEYRRIDVSARIAFGPQLDRLAIFGVLEAGASFANARAARGAAVLGEVSRAPFWLGAGAEAHYEVWRALRVSLSLEVARVLSPADYLAASEPVASEGDLRIYAGAGLEWVFR